MLAKLFNQVNRATKKELDRVTVLNSCFERLDQVLVYFDRLGQNCVCFDLTNRKKYSARPKNVHDSARQCSAENFEVDFAIRAKQDMFRPSRPILGKFRLSKTRD